MKMNLPLRYILVRLVCHRICETDMKLNPIFRHDKRTLVASYATAFMQVQSNYFQKRKLWLLNNKQRFSLTFLCLDVSIDLCEVYKSFIFFSNVSRGLKNKSKPA